MNTAFIALGANLGDRLDNMKRAIARLSAEEGISIRTVSPLYETVPVGGPVQGRFLNACAVLKTALPPEELLLKLLSIEDQLGRMRDERWGPRLIDLDLLSYEEVTLKTPILELPHPRLAERDFVLIPLFDIAPDLLISGLDMTVSDIIAARGPATGVNLFRLSGWHE